MPTLEHSQLLAVNITCCTFYGTSHNLKDQREFDHHLYKERNLVERFINRIKQYRRVATRYEKTARNFLAFVQVAAITVLLL